MNEPIVPHEESSYSKQNKLVIVAIAVLVTLIVGTLFNFGAQEAGIEIHDSGKWSVSAPNGYYRAYFCGFDSQNSSAYFPNHGCSDHAGGCLLGSWAMAPGIDLEGIEPYNYYWVRLQDNIIQSFQEELVFYALP